MCQVFFSSFFLFSFFFFLGWQISVIPNESLKSNHTSTAGHSGRERGGGGRCGEERKKEKENKYVGGKKKVSDGVSSLMLTQLGIATHAATTF